MKNDGLEVSSADAAELPAKNWQRTLWLMVLVQFIMTASLSIAEPVFPLFLPELGVLEPGAIQFWTGVLSSMNFLIAALMAPFWGWVADRHGRKAMVLRSSLALCVFTGVMGLSQNFWQLLGLRGLMGAFSGFSSSAIALVATQVPERRLGFALGWLATGQLVGGLIGPVIGGLIADISGNLRFVFFCTSSMTAVAVTIIFFCVRERFSREPKKSRSSPLAAVTTLARIPGLIPLFLVLLMAQFGVRSVQPVITLFVKDLVGSTESLATLAGFAFSITGLADLIASPFLGKRSDSIGYRRVLLISLLGAIVATAPQAFVTNYWQFVALRFLLGMFVGGILPTANALVGRLVTSSNRGAAYGLTASATLFGSFLGPFIGGSVAASFGIPWVFTLTACLFSANLIWVFLAVPRDKQKQKILTGEI